MITKQEAMTIREVFFIITNPRNNHYGEIRKARVNGQCKTWKTRPQDFRLPFKYGMYEYGYIDQDNAGGFWTSLDAVKAEHPEAIISKTYRY